MLRALIAHLRDRKEEFVSTQKVHGPIGSGYTSDAGTYWPPDEGTIGEVETVDFDKLLQEMDAFAETFKDFEDLS